MIIDTLSPMEYHRRNRRFAQSRPNDSLLTYMAGVLAMMFVKRDRSILANAGALAVLIALAGAALTVAPEVPERPAVQVPEEAWAAAFPHARTVVERGSIQLIWKGPVKSKVERPRLLRR